VVILGWIRDNKNFDSLDDLIKEIKNDIEVGKNELDSYEYKNYEKNEFFKK
jgi:FAD synthase